MIGGWVSLVNISPLYSASYVSTTAVSQQIWCDPLPLPHIAWPFLLESRFLINAFKQPLDLPGGEMAIISALEDMSFIPAI